MELADDVVADVKQHLVTIRDSLGALEAILGLDMETLTLPGSTAPVAGSMAEFEIVDQSPVRELRYRWPTGMTDYVDTIKYAVRIDDAEYAFAIGAEKGGRLSYQRVDRGRVVVFIRSKISESSYYPLIEFAESDLEPTIYAAIVPRPAAPRSGATAEDLELLREVPHLAKAELERADKVFHSLRNGPSLRLLVRRDDPRSMIEHAWWVGVLRGTVA